MCRAAAITGEIKLRPYFFVSEAEREQGRVNRRQVIIQSSGIHALLPMKNKEWFQDRFAAVSKAIAGDFHLIQVGSKDDPPIAGAEDFRGRTSITELASLLANAVLFIGLVGFLMHLARAVDCRSVIIYGGRERPWQSGYTCNINLTGDTPCSPCWRWSSCDYDHECMKLISPEAVIEAISAQAKHHGSPLECATVAL